MNKRKSHPHNFSATVDGEQRVRLEAIESVYGRAANPSAIASHLLRFVADLGPKGYPRLMQRLTEIRHELSKG